MNLDGALLADTDFLSRFLLHGDWKRSDGTVRPDAFMPDGDNELSLLRHFLLTETGIWDAGRTVARLRNKTLHGRVDMDVSVFTAIHLQVKAAPTDELPNHAVVVGWPDDRHARKSKAQVIAAKLAETKRHYKVP